MVCFCVHALFKKSTDALHHNDAASGWTGWALDHPEFGVSVHPFPTGGGADHAHHITACPPGFENLTAPLHHYICCVIKHTLYSYYKLKLLYKLYVLAISRKKENNS